MRSGHQFFLIHVRSGARPPPPAPAVHRAFILGVQCSAHEGARRVVRERPARITMRNIAGSPRRSASMRDSIRFRLKVWHVAVALLLAAPAPVPADDVKFPS